MVNYMDIVTQFKNVIYRSLESLRRVPVKRSGWSDVHKKHVTGRLLQNNVVRFRGGWADRKLFYLRGAGIGLNLVREGGLRVCPDPSG